MPRPIKDSPKSISVEEATRQFPETDWVGCLRWAIEENFELAKGEKGLGHYEVTRYI